ncbi:hypothetical protein C3Y05_020805 [Aeromonas allosaccharophila]|uniref:hypothetical protein n=1 Tax=Aeromonas allosaccharophila TaxID=656 RepID=UPI0013CAB32D|nr:hypothetical protein [Aeromonas allosaccharophila]WDO02029.1 hypothetical protein C3Y05_020805 [Aeromonas allosaccharophila]
MKTRNKTLLALASTVVLLSGCGGGGGDSGSSSSPAPETKATLTPETRPPVVLPVAGLYDAGLLKRDGTSPAPIMIDGLRGLALIYPKNETEQRWTVSVKGQENTQWVGNASQTVSKSGIYPVSVTRTSDRATDIAPLTESGRNIVAQRLLTVKGAYPGFYFNQTSKSADVTPFYPGWIGLVALSPIKSATGLLVADAWQQKDAKGNDFAFVNTANKGGELTVDIGLSAANCTLEGKGVASKGLSKLDVTGFDGVQCDFRQSSALSPIENRWMAGLAKVGKDQSVTAYVATYTSAANQELLVIGFPDLDGLLITADKQ